MGALQVTCADPDGDAHGRQRDQRDHYGISLNVNQAVFAPGDCGERDILQPCLRRKVSRAAITAHTWNHFEETLRDFSRTRDFSELHDAYEKGLVNKGTCRSCTRPQAPLPVQLSGST